MSNPPFLTQYFKRSTEEKMFYYYRYISLLLTSGFYMFGPPHAPVHFKLLVVFSLFLSSILIMSLYAKNKESKKIIKVLILLETLGITLLLLPTGGLESPFLWYALNPVLLAGRYFRRYFCWLTLLFFMCSAILMSLFFFNIEGVTFLELIYKESHLFLILILVTLAVQLLSVLLRELDYQSKLLKKKSERLVEVNEHLEELNKQTEQSVEYIMSLYQMVEAFTDRENRNDLAQLFAEYTQKITRSNNGFFYLNTIGHKEQFALAGNGDIDQLKIKEHLATFKSTTVQNCEISIKGRNLLVVSIHTAYNQKGFIGVDIQNFSAKDVVSTETKLLFLANLSKVILERFHLENLSSELIISEEQNRIANEMHDSVSQRLFALVYALHALSATHKNLSENEVKEQLQSLQKSAHTAIQELRSTIHQLSIRKRNKKPFKSRLEQFLLDQTKLYEASLDFKFSGDETRLSGSLQQAIYRIICEGSGNALRHGLCENLEITLSADGDIVTLIIKDDGNGFTIDKESSGLGISNIKHLASKFGGSAFFESGIGKGTTLTVSIPLFEEKFNTEISCKEVAI